MGLIETLERFVTVLLSAAASVHPSHIITITSIITFTTAITENMTVKPPP
jgi:hypothetical protein